MKLSLIVAPQPLFVMTCAAGARWILDEVKLIRENLPLGSDRKPNGPIAVEFYFDEGGRLIRTLYRQLGDASAGSDPRRCQIPTRHDRDSARRVS